MGDAWKDGRRAWERLDGWGDGSPARSGEAALRALDDIHTVRRLLDQAELGAVKAARAEKKSWAEIATRLGVTRQSAWERWRDLDETQPEATAEDVLGPELDRAASELTGRATRAERRRRQRYPTVVPDVIGMSWEAAHHMLQAKGLVVAGVDPDGVPLTISEQRDHRPEPGGVTDNVVTDQNPQSGTVIETGDVVTLWLGRGGGSAGVREPRRPRPTPLTERQSLTEPSEAVG